MSDDVSVTDGALVELVARAISGIYRTETEWNDAPRVPHQYVERWQCEDASRAAIAAMQPTLDAARDAGRRDGLEHAATTCERKAIYIRRMNTYRGRVNAHGDWGAWVADDCTSAIRALIPTALAPIDAADAR